MYTDLRARIRWRPALRSSLAGLCGDWLSAGDLRRTNPTDHPRGLSPLPNHDPSIRHRLPMSCTVRPLFFNPREGASSASCLCVRMCRLCRYIQWSVYWLFLKTHPANCLSVYNYISVRRPKINPLDQSPLSVSFLVNKYPHRDPFY